MLSLAEARAVASKGTLEGLGGLDGNHQYARYTVCSDASAAGSTALGGCHLAIGLTADGWQDWLVVDFAGLSDGYGDEALAPDGRLVVLDGDRAWWVTSSGTVTAANVTHSGTWGSGAFLTGRGAIVEASGAAGVSVITPTFDKGAAVSTSRVISDGHLVTAKVLPTTVRVTVQTNSQGTSSADLPRPAAPELFPVLATGAGHRIALLLGQPRDDVAGYQALFLSSDDGATWRRTATAAHPLDLGTGPAFSTGGALVLTDARNRVWQLVGDGLQPTPVSLTYLPGPADRGLPLGVSGKSTFLLTGAPGQFSVTPVTGPQQETVRGLGAAPTAAGPNTSSVGDTCPSSTGLEDAAVPGATAWLSALRAAELGVDESASVVARGHQLPAEADVVGRPVPASADPSAAAAIAQACGQQFVASTLVVTSCDQACRNSPGAQASTEWWWLRRKGSWLLWRVQ